MLNLRQSNRTALLDPSCKSEETLDHVSEKFALQSAIVTPLNVPSGKLRHTRKYDYVQIGSCSFNDDILVKQYISASFDFIFFVVCFHNWHIYFITSFFLRVFVFGNMLQIDLFVRLTWLHGIKWPLNCLYAVAPSDILLQEVVAIWGLNWQIYSECLHNTAWL